MLKKSILFFFMIFLFINPALAQLYSLTCVDLETEEDHVFIIDFPENPTEEERVHANHVGDGNYFELYVESQTYKCSQISIKKYP